MHKSEELEEKLSKFGEKIIDLVKGTAKNIVTTPTMDQLLRSGTSVGANYMEANGASSNKDFKNKIFFAKRKQKKQCIGLGCWQEQKVRNPRNAENCGKSQKATQSCFPALLQD